MDAHPGVMEACTGAVVEAHPGARKAHPGAWKAHPGARKAHPGGIESHSVSVLLIHPHFQREST